MKILFDDYVDHIKTNQPCTLTHQGEHTVILQSDVKNDTTYFSYEATLTEQMKLIYPSLACFKETVLINGCPFYENIRCIVFHSDFHYLHVTFRMQNVRDYTEKVEPTIGLYKDNWVYLYQPISTQHEKAVFLQAIKEKLLPLILELPAYRLLHATGMIAQKGEIS